MKSKKGDLDFSLDLPSRSIRQFVCFPPIFCTSLVQLAAICVNFETLRNFVSVLLSTLVFFFLKFCSKLSLVFYFSVRLLQRAESTGLRLLAPSHDPAVKVLNPVMDDNYWQEFLLLLLLLLLIFWMFC